MLTTFIVIAVLMCLVACAAVGLPLWFGKKDEGEANRREMTLNILRQQAEDLEEDRKAGRIDEDEYEETRLELERRVLEETRHDEKVEAQNHSSLSRVLAVVLVILIPASAATGYMALGRYTAMDEHFLEMMEAQKKTSGGHSAAEMSRIIDQLKDRLEKNPMDPEGWFMLARTTASVNRFDESVEAFRRLSEIVPNNADIIADMADMMAAANGKVITPDVEKLLNKALSIDPDQWKALALLAIHAWDKEQYARAAELWEHLLLVVPPEFPDIEQIRANINEAKRLGGVNDNVARISGDAEGGKAAASQGAAPADKTPVPTVNASAEYFVAGTVTLSPELKDKVKPDDAVFIYARPVTGSKMPLAFVRVTVKDLPYNFELNANMTMAMGAETMENHKEVVVGARISKTGNFMPQAGDLEGEMKQPVAVGDRGIALMINGVRK